MSNVNFFQEDCDYIIANQDVIAHWILDIIGNEKKKSGEINIILCSDEYLLDLNQKFLERDTYTDVIAFDYNEPDLINGDIFISIDRVQENAKQYDVAETVELQRVIAHGVLHLLGYQDNTDVKKQKMRRLEDKYLQML